ncbi:ABC transporter permease subunit, partial [Lacticaseibacillus paracasei]
MWSILTNNWGTFMSGVGYTLASSILALIGSLIVGTLFALLEISPFKSLRVIGRIYVEIVRNIPLLVITLAFYVIVPQFIVKIDGFTAGTIGLLIYT